jgi:hypothetical protein
MDTTPDAISPTNPVNDDSLLMPFSQLVHDLAEYNKNLEDPISGQVMTVEQVKLDMPVEINIAVDDQGKVTLQGSPPTQRTETTILPVFHQLKLRVVRDEDGE